MGIQIRLKTGFFETGNYRLETGENQLRLYPEDTQHSKILIFSEQDILSITLKDKRLPEFELQTRDTIYSGVFVKRADLKDTFELVKTSLNTTIICEYEGGKLK